MTVAHPITDAEELACWIEEEAEIHFLEELASELAEPKDTAHERGACSPGMLLQSLGPEKLRANRLFGFEEHSLRRKVSEPGRPIAPRVAGKARREPARLAINRSFTAHQEDRASDSY